MVTSRLGPCENGIDSLVPSLNTWGIASRTSENRFVQLVDFYSNYDICNFLLIIKMYFPNSIGRDQKLYIINLVF